ncbi:hypothetical protein N9Z27_01040 [Alphaproteobacteria bacterium]|nr:hypothetical protein [Alphaproteobacteria bacterium]
MKRRPILIMIFTAFMLTACGDKNPLEAHDPMVLAEWLYQKKDERIELCAEAWANLDSAEPLLVRACEEKLEEVAKMLTKAGYGKVKPHHAQLPTVWFHFNGRVRNRKSWTYNPEIIKKAYEDAAKKRKEK